MDSLWLLRGAYEAPGWTQLEHDARAGTTDVLCFDRAAWALVRAADAPAAYAGLTAEAAPAGLYLDEQGRPVYVAGGRSVRGALEVVKALGDEAQALLGTLGDADRVLERLGRVY